MENRGLRRFKLMTRLSLSAVLALIAMLVITWEALETIHEALYEDRQVKTRHLVEIAHGVVEHFHAQQKSGALAEEEAKKQAIVAIKSLRYDKTEYFWLQDMTKPVPKMIMHPTVPALDGKVLDEARFNKATSMLPGLDGTPTRLDGRNLFVAFDETVARAGHGYVEYQWPKPLPGGGVTPELYPKLSYVKKFEPWGWVIGSGIYIDDVDQLFKRHASHSITLALLGTIVLLLTGWLIRRSILDEFGGEPRVALKVTNQIAAGDLTHAIELKPGDRSSVLYVLDLMQTSLKDMLRSVFANASRVEGSIERLSAESGEITMATQFQANAIEQTRSAIGEVAHSVEVVNGLARDTETGSQQVAQRAHQGAEAALRVAAEMQTIAETVAASSTEVSRLVESTREIDKMANVIKEIADQTNLLALNAAIEAARAGEQGRGFAVVADEVRKLAERTTQATREIGGILQGIERDTERAIGGMNAAAPLIAGGVAEANAAAETLRAIEQQSQETLGKMQQLAQATHDQTLQIQAIVGNVDDVMQASGRTETVIQQSLQTASELETAAGAMFDMVKRFNIGATGGVDSAGSNGSRGHSGQPLMEWSAALTVGHGEIDRQHRRLIDIANKLNAAMQAGQARDAIGQILGELIDYTVGHLSWEEKLMADNAYSDLKAHAAIHRKLIEDVKRFKQQFDSGNTAIAIELMGFIRDWLINHILKVDKALAKELATRGVR